MLNDKDLQMELERIFQSLQNSANPTLAQKIADVKEALLKKESSPTVPKNPEVQILTNGQVVNVASPPLSVTQPPVNAVKVEHDSPVIVHQCNDSNLKNTRVSFDLTSKTSDTEAAIEEVSKKVLDEDQISSCHSSRCCCSSYVCSVCSPHGSINSSIDIASPRPTFEHEDQPSLEMSSKITQTESNHSQIHASEQPILTNGKTEDKQKNKPKTSTHRILINLDDKNRFTDEVTV